MRVLAAMSGGVDSSVAAALLVDQGHEVVGVTMKLWRYPADTGCCSAAEVDDARRVAQQLGIDHWVLSFLDDFDASVVDPYVDAHAAGLTPNPCIECNRSIKFDRLLRRADQLGFDAVASGHYARVDPDGSKWRLRRAADGAKDQSYVLYVLGQRQLGRVLFPLGAMTKADVRERSRRMGLPTWDLPASPCLSSRIPRGMPVSPEILRQVERAEEAVRALGFRELRVRHLGEAARVEIAPAEMERLDAGLRGALERAVLSAGYLRCVVDPAGYRRGRLNEPLPLTVIGPA